LGWSGGQTKKDYALRSKKKKKEIIEVQKMQIAPKKKQWLEIAESIYSLGVKTQTHIQATKKGGRGGELEN